MLGATLESSSIAIQVMIERLGNEHLHVDRRFFPTAF